VDLYRLGAYESGDLDLSPHAKQAYVYTYSPLFGLLEERIKHGRLAPRSYTCFAPMKRLHRRIAADIRSRGYDVVLAHTDGMTQSPYLLRWLAGTPSVYFCQETLRVAQERAVLDEHRRQLREGGAALGAIRVFEDALVLKWLGAEDLQNARSATKVVVNSRYSRERVWSAYAREAEVCYLGVDVERFSPGDVTERDREVLSIGAPIHTKGHRTVVEAIGRLPAASRPRLRVITPRPGGVSSLEALAASRDVDLVVEVAADEDGLIRRYRQAMATVCAARLEPFGLTALESMACGTPVVAFREGGFQESVVDGETGILVEPDTKALADALQRLCADAKLGSRLAQGARAHVQSNWTWERSGARLDEIVRTTTRKSP
jgi:glycosyltransferase involved in cell wall biosynthesis